MADSGLADGLERVIPFTGLTSSFATTFLGLVIEEQTVGTNLMLFGHFPMLTIPAFLERENTEDVIACGINLNFQTCWPHEK